MPKYLAQCNYVGESEKGLLKEGGSSLRAVVENLIQSIGGTIEAFYYAFGETDLYVILDAPDNVSVATAVLTVNIMGDISVKTIVLITPEEMDEAVKRSPAYRAPGSK
jgi:uncharacterized protein with GYD domain